MAEAVTVLGGPGGNVVLFALLASAAASGVLPSAVALHLAIPQLLLAAGNLLPFSVQRQGRRVGSDGAQLLGLLRTPKISPADDLLEWVRQVVPDAGPADLTSAMPTIGRCAVSLLTEQEGWVRRDAAALLSALLDGRALTTPERILVLSILTEAELLRGNTGAGWDDPERWIHEASRFSSTRGTQMLRGAALIRSNRLVDARTLLNEVLAADPAPNLALCCCVYLARAAHAANDPAAADNAVCRAETIAAQAGHPFDKREFLRLIQAAPVPPGHTRLQRPSSEMTRAGMVAATLLVAGLSAVLAGSVAYRAGERRGYLAACDERDAARLFYSGRLRGVECVRAP